ncbi:MAG: hypothetical protein ACJAS1_001622 [Oleiphilaceae bacterium]|jgi:hypothetical protein
MQELQMLKVSAQDAHNNHLKVKKRFINRECDEQAFQKAFQDAEDAKQKYNDVHALELMKSAETVC